MKKITPMVITQNGNAFKVISLNVTPPVPKAINIFSPKGEVENPTPQQQTNTSL